MPPVATKSNKPNFRAKVKVKVTRSLTLVSFESMQAKYEVSTSNGSKFIANVKVDNRRTNKQTNKQTDREDKNNMPRSLDPGA